jgi:hypothetical protein
MILINFYSPFIFIHKNKWLLILKICMPQSFTKMTFCVKLRDMCKFDDINIVSVMILFTH